MQVEMVLKQHALMAKTMGKSMKGVRMNKKGDVNMSMDQMARMIPPNLLNQMGGKGALEQMMKQLSGKGGPGGGLGGLANMMKNMK